MERNFPDLPFERYADDVICHCRSEKQAKYLLDTIRCRLAECRLELHPEKTKIVFCKDSYRRGTMPTRNLIFWGLRFGPAYRSVVMENSL